MLTLHTGKTLKTCLRNIPTYLDTGLKLTHKGTSYQKNNNGFFSLVSEKFSF